MKNENLTVKIYKRISKKNTIYFTLEIQCRAFRKMEFLNEIEVSYLQALGIEVDESQYERKEEE